MEQSYAFPSDLTDPRIKQGKEWILQYAKAIYWTSNNVYRNNIYFGQNQMNEVRAYGLGMQPIDKYKKQKFGDEQADGSWESIDWSVLDYLSKYRNIAVAKINQRSYDIQCRAVDPLSKTEEDAYFNQMKSKILMRETAQKMGSELADSPMLKPAPDEPQDVEQLQMEMEFGYKSILSMEAEMAIQLIQQQNNFAQIRRRVIEDLVDFGIGCYTNFIDENGNVITKHIDPRQLVLSPFYEPNGSDLTYWGVVEEVYLGEIAKYFDGSDLKKIGELAKGQWGNPAFFNYNNPNWYHKCKVLVMDFKLKSYNTRVWEERQDKDANIRFGKTDYSNLSRIAINSDGNLESGSEEMAEDTSQPKYAKDDLEVVYKGKWILNSDYIYGYGLSENMIRKPSSRCNTSLDLQLYSWNFDRGMFSGLTKKLIPLEDQACLIWYKMQNLAAKLVPYIINIDMTALENVAYGAAGEKNSPKDIIDFVFSNFAALTRSEDLLKNNTNSQPLRPVTIEASGQLYAMQELRNQMAMIENQIRAISGLNELTDGSTPNERMLTTTANAAIASTNNALEPINFADEQLVQQNADHALCKLQIAITLGKVEGYVRVMGQDTLKFMQINPNLSIREFGIFARVMPSYEERQMLLNDLSIKESQGLVDITDKELVMSCSNIKQAMMVLGYRIKKRKEEQQQFELQKIQENNQGQQQMIALTAQSQQQTIQMQLQADLIRIQTEKQWDYTIEMAKKDSDLQAQVYQADARTVGNQILHDSKIKASAITGEYQIAKQEIANQKPKTTAK